MVTYQLILDEVDAMRKSTINWQVFDMGIEALIKSVAPHNRREGYSHQSFTLGDLLMKVSKQAMSQERRKEKRMMS